MALFGFNSRLYEMLMSVFYLSMQLNAPRCVALAILIGTSQLVNNIRCRRIWKSSIRLDTKIRLYQTYIVPVLLYGCETWSTTKLQCSRIDAFDMWALRKILRIPYTRHVTNVEVGATTGCHPLSHLVTDRRLRLFGHIVRSSPQEDHHRAVAAVIRGLPPDWKRPSGMT